MHKWCLFPEVIEEELDTADIIDRSLDPHLRWRIVTYCWLWMSVESEPMVIVEEDIDG